MIRPRLIGSVVMVSQADAAGKAARAAVSLGRSAFRRTTSEIMAFQQRASLSQSTLRSEALGDIESAAYLGSYDPTNLCLNYLGDSGIVGLGTTIPNASYSFVVPAQSDFVVVVNTTGTITASSQFSGTVSGFFDFTPGPGPCP